MRKGEKGGRVCGCLSESACCSADPKTACASHPPSLRTKMKKSDGWFTSTEMWKWWTFPRVHIYLPLTGTQQHVEHSQLTGDFSKMSHTLPSTAHFFFTDSLCRESSYIRTRWAETCIRSFSSVLGLLFFFFVSSQGLFNPLHQTQLNCAGSILWHVAFVSSGLTALNHDDANGNVVLRWLLATHPISRRSESHQVLCYRNCPRRFSLNRHYLGQSCVGMYTGTTCVWRIEPEPKPLWFLCHLFKHKRDEMRKREKGWSWGRGKITENKGEMRQKVTVITQINEEWSQIGRQLKTLSHMEVKGPMAGLHLAYISLCPLSTSGSLSHHASSHNSLKPGRLQECTQADTRALLQHTKISGLTV